MAHRRRLAPPYLVSAQIQWIIWMIYRSRRPMLIVLSLRPPPLVSFKITIDLYSIDHHDCSDRHLDCSCLRNDSLCCG